MAAVMGDGHPFGQVGGIEVVGQALGGLADGVNIHPVGAGAQYAAQPAGAEGQVAVEPVGDGGFLPFNGSQLRRQGGVQVRPAAPGPVTGFYFIHGTYLLHG